MYGWIKHFTDGTKEVGTDDNIRQKKASWTKGRLQNMLGAEVHAGNVQLVIMGAGEYWQSNDYDVDVFQKVPTMVIRRLQHKIIDGVKYGVWRIGIHIISVAPLHYMTECDLVPIEIIDMNSSESTDKWITLEYDIQSNNFSWRLEDNKI